VTDENETLIQEVNERLRHEKQLALLKRFGPWLLGAFVAALVGLGGWLWYKDWSVNTARVQADKFIVAQQKARSSGADASAAEFEALSKQGPQSYRVMALMERAAALEGKGDLDGAVAGFDAAAEAARDPLLRDSARLRAAYIVADSQDFAALKARLDPLIKEGGAISFLARELLGVEAWEAGQIDLARETLDNLNLAFDAPESVRQRVNLALAVLPPAPAATLEQAASPPAEKTSTGDAQ
jgi:hypothetical protein